MNESERSAEYEESVEYAKSLLAKHRDLLEEDVRTYGEFLSTANYTHSESGADLRKQMAKILKEDSLSLEWLDGGNESSEARVCTANTMDRIAEHYAMIAKMNLGEERIHTPVPQTELTPTEKVSLEESGKISYFANILRNGAEK